MSPEELVRALLGTEHPAARRALLTPRDDDFYVAVTGLLKDEADGERLRDPNAALRTARIAAEVADFAAIPRCQALAAWAVGNVLIHLGDYGECLRLYRQAAEFFASEGAEIEMARLTSNQAFVLRNLGRYEEGLQAVQAALAVLRKHPPSLFLASALNGLGALYRSLGRYEDALAAYSECEHIYASLDDDVRQARVAINKAAALEYLDQFGDAIALLQEARAVLAKHERRLEVARADLNLGIIYTRLGRYDEALAALDGAEQGFAALDNAMEMAVVALYRADLYASFNLYEELLQTSARDWPLFEERQMQWQAARATLHRAVAWRRLGGLAQAENLLDGALEAFGRIGDSIWAQLVHLERAALWCEIGEWQRALSVVLDTAAFFEEKKMPTQAARSFLLAGQCHLALDNLPEAIEHYQSVLDLAQALSIPSLAYRARHGFGLVAKRQGRLQDAYEHFHQAVETVELLRQRLRVEEFRLGFLEDKLEVYRDAVLLCLQMGREQEAFGYVERAKSGALVDLIVSSLSQHPSAGEGAGQDLMARLNALREQLNWHYSKLETDGTGQRGQRWPIEEGEVWERISAIEDEMADTWRELQRAMPFYTVVDLSQACTPEAVQACLQRQEALLQYYVAGETIYVFVIDQGGLRLCLPLSCTVSQIGRTAGALEPTLRGAARFEASYVARVLGPLSRQQLGWLYDDLLRPVLPAVGNPDRLIIAPDGVLFEVPFHALYDGEQYLLEQYEVTYAPSAGALRLCRENECRRNGTSRQAFVIGCTLGDKLPYVQQEIEAVARAIPGATVVSGEVASLPSLQGYAAESGVLHLATHAVFRRDNPLFSALQLAGEDWLRLMDLYSLRLNGALVTLSGCETGRHRLLGGDLLGLSRGFFYAGASALVVSLWPVDDMSTAILMERFYTHLVAGMAAASALRQAQVELYHLEVERDGQWLRPYAHPFYWAPFCLLGAPGV